MNNMKEYKIEANTPLAEALKDKPEAQQQVMDLIQQVQRDERAK